MTKNVKNETKELVYTVEKEIATISETGTAKKKLTFMSWGDNPAKYDLRTWVTRPDGSEIPKKGITLDIEECKALCKALSEIKDETPKTAKKTTGKKETGKKVAKAPRNMASNKKIPNAKSKNNDSESLEMLTELLLDILAKTPESK